VAYNRIKYVPTVKRIPDELWVENKVYSSIRKTSEAMAVNGRWMLPKEYGLWINLP
jgi:hypothetical protein